MTAARCPLPPSLVRARVHALRSGQAERPGRGPRSPCQRCAVPARRAPRAHGRACPPAPRGVLNEHLAPRWTAPTRAPSAGREEAQPLGPWVGTELKAVRATAITPPLASSAPMRRAWEQPNSGYYLLALRDQNRAATIRLELDLGARQQFSSSEKELFGRIACSARLGQSRLQCVRPWFARDRVSLAQVRSPS